MFYKLELSMHFDNETYANNLKSLLEEANILSIDLIKDDPDHEPIFIEKIDDPLGWCISCRLGFRGDNLNVNTGQSEPENMTDLECAQYYYNKILNDFMDLTVEYEINSESEEEEEEYLNHACNQISYHYCGHDVGKSCSGVVQYVKNPIMEEI